jgi:hypothetical protein
MPHPAPVAAAPRRAIAPLVARRTLVLAGLVAAVALLVTAPAASASWARPVRAAVTQGFDVQGSPFAAGQHRGADFAAPPGTPVHAACGGRVVVAGRIGASGGVVTVTCGPWRVSHLPLAGIAVAVGERIAAGSRIGTAGRSAAHAGLHLGVRLASRRFGYVDPLRFMPARRIVPPPGPAPGPERLRPPARVPHATPARAVPPASAPAEPAHALVTAPVPATHPVVPAPVPATRALAATHPAPAPTAFAAASAPARPLAPALAWAGLALLLAGAARGLRLRRASVARRRVFPPRAVRGEVR